MNDQRLYAKVAEELRKHGPNEGLWAKAFAESNGVESRAKALYLRYRVQQIAETEQHEMLSEKARIRKLSEIQRKKLLEEKAANSKLDYVNFVREEEERQKRAAAEGITPIHIVLVSLMVFIVAAILIKGLHVYRIF